MSKKNFFPVAKAGSRGKVVASPTKLNSSLDLASLNFFWKSMLCFICMKQSVTLHRALQGVKQRDLTAEHSHNLSFGDHSLKLVTAPGDTTLGVKSQAAPQYLRSQITLKPQLQRQTRKYSGNPLKLPELHCFLQPSLVQGGRNEFVAH